MKKPTYKELARAFTDAMEHLDWCGWGDRYERACVQENGTIDRLTDVYNRLPKEDAAEKPR